LAQLLRREIVMPGAKTRSASSNNKSPKRVFEQQKREVRLRTRCAGHDGRRLL